MQAKMDYITEAKYSQDKLQENGLKLLKAINMNILCPQEGMITHWDYGQEVYVKNLPPSITTFEIYARFSVFGRVRQVKLPVHNLGEAKRYAFVLYESVEEAINAIKKANGLVLRYLCGSYKLQVMLSRDNRKIFINNIPKRWTQDWLEHLAATQCQGFKEMTFWNKSYCFMEFNTYTDAAAAIRTLRNIMMQILGNNQVYVNWANPEPLIDPVVMDQVTTLFVRGLSFTTNVRDLKMAICISLWPFKKLDIDEFDVKRRKNYAFITFKSRLTALVAKMLLDGATMDGQKLTVCWARPHEPKYRIPLQK